MDIKARDETIRRIQDTVAALQTQVAISRELREVSQNLRQDNAGSREFLRETLLASFSTQERLRDK
jgi:hypothetical protein